MTFPKNIERWRKVATYEAADLPVDLVLAVIQHESGGVAGLRAGRATKHARDLPTASGGTKRLQHAAGLMQTIPVLVEAWNKNVGKPIITADDLEGKDERAARIQTRLGVTYLAGNFARLHKYDSAAFPSPVGRGASPNQTTLSLVAYAAGFPGLKKKLDVLKSEGLPLTFEALKQRFPKWGYSDKAKKWINRPVHYGATVFNNYSTRATGAGPQVGRVPPLPARKTSLPKIEGWAVVALALLVYSYFVGVKSKRASA